MEFSADQAAAYDLVTDVLAKSGVDLTSEVITPSPSGKAQILAVLGRAGSGKTVLLAELAQALERAEIAIVQPDYEPKSLRDQRSLAILAPTNKAASVLRNRGIAATTIHRILYIPVYNPDYERIAEWLAGKAERPEIEGLSDAALDRAAAFYQQNKSIPGAFAAAGLRGSDFISGWKRRDDPLDIGFVDEASMLDEAQLDDLKKIFNTLVLFGDPAQLAPVGQSGEMIFEKLPKRRLVRLEQIHRQAADNPILTLAHALADPELDFPAFEALVAQTAQKDDRVVVAQRAEADLMAKSPILCWRNATRIRLIHAFRAAYGAAETHLLEGEPLICDGIELPVKHRKKRIDLEARGLVKGAQAFYLGPGRRPGFSRVHILGAPEPQISVATIIKIEAPDQEEPIIPSAARMGAAFVHGAACTIHKAQGSQWPQVQVFAPDLYAAARAGRVEAGLPLWKRLAYVAITRAQEQLFWVARYRLGRPSAPLETQNLGTQSPGVLNLSATE